MIGQDNNKVSGLQSNKSFFNSVVTIVGGTAGAQLLAVLAAPVLTRLYNPDAFGVLAVFVGLLGVLSVLASLRFELAIPQVESEEEAANLVILSLLLVLLIGLLVSLSVWLWGDPLVERLQVHQLRSYLWLLPVGLVLTGIYQVFYYWAVRCRAFTAVARTKVQQSLVMLVVQITAHKIGVLALLGGYALGQGAGSLHLVMRAGPAAILRNASWLSLGVMAYRFRRYPLFSTWSGLLNSAGAQLPALLLAYLFSPAAAGLYALAQRVIGMPISVIGTAVANVFLPSAADAHREGELAPLVGRLHYVLANIAMPPTFILALCGPQLFALVFGEPWREAGELTRWLTPMLYMTFVTAPMSSLFGIMDRQAEGLLFQALLFLIRALGLIVGALILHSLWWAVLLFSLGSSLSYLGFLAWIILRSGNSLKVLVHVVFRAFFISIVMMVPLAVGLYLFADSFFWLACLGITCLLVGAYYFRLLRTVKWGVK